MPQPDPTQICDLTANPIAAPGPARAALVAATRARLEAEGCAVLKGFVRAEALPGLIAEAAGVHDKAHWTRSRTNPYFTKDAPDLPPSHPRRRFYDRSNGFIPADNFGPASALRALYEWPLFADFIQEALGETRFHRYADPLADVIVNAAEAGDGFPWHFDTNNFTVTLALQNAETGGEFEYAPGLRTRAAENYDAVQAVLDGDRRRVRRLTLEPGDLQIFKGRHALHRVAPLSGAKPRYVAIFSFVEEPGMVATPERARQLYGRVLPIHLERAGLRADGLVD